MNDSTAHETVTLPAHAARLLAVEVLLADPEALQNDALEGDLYILLDRLREEGAACARKDGRHAGDAAGDQR